MRFKLYSDGRLFDANADPAEQHDLANSTDPAVHGQNPPAKSPRLAAARPAAAVPAPQPLGVQDPGEARGEIAVALSASTSAA